MPEAKESGETSGRWLPHREKASKRSKDPATKVGACIVNKNNIIVGVGYNGFPKGCRDDAFPWNKRKNPDSNGEHKHLYVCHAEANAILNKTCCSAEGCRIYVALFPCNDCAKFIIQSGIVEVIYMSDKYAHKMEYVAAKKMFAAANIETRKFSPGQGHIQICFDESL